MSQSLWAKYLKEREGKETIEHQGGFIVYKFIGEKECYIVDVYVEPEFRRHHLATELADKVVRIAKEKGCTHLFGSVDPNLKSATNSILVLTGYGMRLHSASQGALFFVKEI